MIMNHNNVVLICLEVLLAWADRKMLREVEENHGSSWYVVVARILLLN